MGFQIRYFLLESFRTFGRAKWMSLVTVFTIGILLFLAMSFAALFWYVHLYIAGAQAKMEMVAFVDEAYSSLDSAVVLRRQIEAIAGVERANWVSKDSAVQAFRTIYGSEMLEAVDQNPLPASFHISLSPSHRNNQSMQNLQEQITAIGGLEEASYGKEWFPALEQIQRAFGAAALGLGLVTFFALYWTISNTVRLSLFARRDVIKIMRLVGATDFFIRIPFYLEGVLTGLLGSGLAILLSIMAYRFLHNLVPQIAGLADHAYPLFIGTAMLGTLLAVAGCRSSLKRFLP